MESLAQQGPDVAPAFAALLVLFVVLIGLVALAIKLLICCKIFSKAGYCWVFGVLMLVPIANIIMAFYLAFADWPVRKELRQLKQQRAGTST